MLKKLAGQTATYGLSSILARLMGNLLLPLQTGRLSLNDFSVLSEALAWAALLSVLFPLGLETALFRFSNETPDEKDKTENQIISFQIFCAAALAFPALLFFHWCMPVLDSAMLLVLVSTLILDSIQGIFMASLRNRQASLAFLKVRLTAIGLNILLNLFFLSDWSLADQLNPIGLNYRLILWINLGCTVFSFLPMLMRMREFSWKFNEKLNRKLLAFSIPMVGISLVGVGNDILGRVWLEKLCPEQFYPGIDRNNLIGIYSGAAKVAVFINLGIQAYRYAADPFFFSFQERKDTARYMASSFTWFLAAGLFALIGIQCNLDLILQIFLRKPEFLLARDAVFFLLLANLAIGVYYNLSFWYKFSGRTWWGTLISLSGFVMNACLNLALVPVLGMNGSALAYLAGTLLMCLASWFLGKQAFPVAWEYGKLGMLTTVALAFCLIPYGLPEKGILTLAAGILLPVFFAVIVLKIQKIPIRKNAT